jgi:carnitine 3-dehydrogenase
MLRDVRSVALVGAGTIGGSWAVVYTRAGLETHVFDPDENQRNGLRTRFERDVALLVESGLLGDDDVQRMRELLVVESDLERAVHAADYVQESVPEDLELKRSVFAQLEGLVPEDVVIGSSVSGLLVTDIARAARNPGRCVGVHPTNPPHVVPLVEIVLGEQTSAEVADWTEGIASAADIDRCVQQGLGLRWAFLGPFGLEHTKAASIADNLHKFGPSIRAMFANVCRPYDEPTEEEIASLAQDVEEMFGRKPQPEIVEYHNRMVLAVRKLKQATNPYVPNH